MAEHLGPVHREPGPVLGAELEEDPVGQVDQALVVELAGRRRRRPGGCRPRPRRCRGSGSRARPTPAPHPGWRGSRPGDNLFTLSPLSVVALDDHTGAVAWFHHVTASRSSTTRPRRAAPGRPAHRPGPGRAPAQVAGVGRLQRRLESSTTTHGRARRRGAGRPPGTERDRVCPPARAGRRRHRRPVRRNGRSRGSDGTRPRSGWRTPRHGDVLPPLVHQADGVL